MKNEIKRMRVFMADYAMRNYYGFNKIFTDLEKAKKYALEKARWYRKMFAESADRKGAYVQIMDSKGEVMIYNKAIFN